MFFDEARQKKNTLGTAPLTQSMAALELLYKVVHKYREGYTFKLPVN